VRRTISFLFNAAAVLSLVLCAAAVVLWIWSYSARLGTIGTAPPVNYVAGVSRGEIYVGVYSHQCSPGYDRAVGMAANGPL
jgi:hypothetical protein